MTCPVTHSDSVRRQPGDQPCRVVRGPPPAPWHRCRHLGPDVSGRPARIRRPGVDGVDGDPARRQRIGQRQHDPAQGRLARRVGHLAPHRAAALARGEQDHPAALRALEARGEGLHQQQRRADVDRQRQVDRLGGHRLDRALARRGVVGDEDVDVAEREPGRAEHRGRRLRLGEVGLEVAGEVQRGVRPPVPRLREHRRPVGDEAARGGEADPLAPADAGDQRRAGAQSPSSRPYSER